MQNLVILADSPNTFRDLLRSTLLELLPSPTTNAAPVESLMSMAEVCKELDISKTTLIAWKKNGLVPFVRLGHRVYFERSKVLDAGRRHSKYQTCKG